jgi:hypothetical protein
VGVSGVQVNIDRIVLRGIDPADRQALVNGLKAELARILADPAARAALNHSRRTPLLRLGKISMGQGTAGASKLGCGIARAIGKGIAR